MKIVFITLKAPFSHSESYVTQELKLIARQPIDRVYIFNLFHQKNLASTKTIVAQQNMGRTLIYLYKNFYKIARAIGGIALRQTPKRALYTLYTTPRILSLAQFCEEQQIDHIHAYWGTTPATCALIVSRITSVKYSFTIHRADIEANDLLIYKTDRAAFVRSISNWGKRLATNLGAPANKIMISHLGVSVPKYSAPSSSIKKIKRLICVCALVNTKRIHELLKILAPLTNTRLTIVGDGPEKKRLERLTRNLGMDDRVKFLSYLTNAQVIRLLKNGKFDLFVSPSAKEGISVAVMEAMAHSTTVAVTNVGGMSELVNKKNGYLLKPDLTNLVDAINKPLSQKMVFSAWSKVSKDFNIKLTAKGLIELIHAS